MKITKFPYAVSEGPIPEIPFIRRGKKDVVIPRIDDDISVYTAQERWMPDLDYLDKYDK